MDGTIEWGAKHAQGIHWCSSEQAARESVEGFVRMDARRQAAVRGRVRLVRRFVGAVEEVENPYDRLT